MWRKLLYEISTKEQLDTRDRHALHPRRVRRNGPQCDDRNPFHEQGVFREAMGGLCPYVGIIYFDIAAGLSNRIHILGTCVCEG